MSAPPAQQQLRAPSSRITSLPKKLQVSQPAAQATAGPTKIGAAFVDIEDGPDAASERRLSRCVSTEHRAARDPLLTLLALHSHWEKPMALLVEGACPLHGIAILHGHPDGDVECLSQVSPKKAPGALFVLALT